MRSKKREKILKLFSPVLQRTLDRMKRDSQEIGTLKIIKESLEDAQLALYSVEMRPYREEILPTFREILKYVSMEERRLKLSSQAVIERLEKLQQKSRTTISIPIEKIKVDEKELKEILENKSHIVNGLIASNLYWGHFIDLPVVNYKLSSDRKRKEFYLISGKCRYAAYKQLVELGERTAIIEVIVYHELSDEDVDILKDSINNNKRNEED